jgi:hypothetical protein
MVFLPQSVMLPVQRKTAAVRLALSSCISADALTSAPGHAVLQCLYMTACACTTGMPASVWPQQ